MTVLIPVAQATATLQLAQTHVLKNLPVTSWNGGLEAELHLIGNRKTLAIVEFGETAVPTSPQLKITNDGSQTPVYLTLNAPSAFPSTFGDVDPSSVDDGEPYSTTAYSVVIDAALIAKGLQISVMLTSGGEKLYDLTGHVGCPSKFKLITIP